MTTGIMQIVPILIHIKNEVAKLEKATNGVVCLQFADHVEGLSMVVRVYTPASEKEHVFPDVITRNELLLNGEINNRIDVLFNLIHNALNSIQVVQDKSGGLIHH